MWRKILRIGILILAALISGIIMSSCFTFNTDEMMYQDLEENMPRFLQQREKYMKSRETTKGSDGAEKETCNEI